MTTHPAITRLRCFVATAFAAVFLFLQPLPSLAGPPTSSGRKALAGQVASLLAKNATGKRVAAIVKGEPAAQKGLVNLVRLAAKNTGATKKAVACNLGTMLFLLEKDLDPEGAARLRKVLGDVTVLTEWSKNNPAARRELESVAAGMTKGRSLCKGSAYEIHLAASYASAAPPGVKASSAVKLLEMQPPAGPRDTRLFRDARIERGGKPAYVEAKFWPRLDEETAVKKLRAQVDSHFMRLKRARKTVEPIPPGHQLIFQFNDRMPDSWKKAIEESTVQALQKHYGMPKSDAKEWRGRNLTVGTANIPIAALIPPLPMDPYAVTSLVGPESSSGSIRGFVIFGIRDRSGIPFQSDDIVLGNEASSFGREALQESLRFLEQSDLGGHAYCDFGRVRVDDLAAPQAWIEGIELARASW
jgi:hypothetical protein